MIVLTLVLAGCSGDSSSVAKADLPKVVLQPADLSGSFERFDEGRQASADQPEGAGRTRLDSAGSMVGSRATGAAAASRFVARS